MRASPYATVLADGRIRCEVCPHACALADGQRGACRVRRREGNAIRCDVYGCCSGLAVDPIEKKPLSHFLPGTDVLSFGTVGCNLRCRFCQNWQLSHFDELTGQSAEPQLIARRAREQGCSSVAFTYNDPVVFVEYAIDTAVACHEQGLATVAVSAGYIHRQARADLFAHIDAANIDLKAFDDAFYRSWCGARLEPVLDTLRYIAHETDTWLEVTTLLIPGLNDAPEQVRPLAQWMYNQLGGDVPWHLSAFHPAGEASDRARTPTAVVHRARAIAHEVGMRFVYTGNIADPAGMATSCPDCGRMLIERGWSGPPRNTLGADAGCPACGCTIPGIFRGHGNASL